MNTPLLTPRRIALAYTVALTADAIQVLLGPLGWMPFDEILDVIAMILTCVLIGFHPLLLPTFLVELIPIVDVLPTWTACVAVVVALRRKQQQASAAPPPVSNAPGVIDV
ncbi:MAG: hypothetical protein HY735_01055 [Verrucomicrobia bacterium]|nr:hypothetical protein [Verrucomicrobiota bacterium]